MDILENFQVFKNQLREISKQLIELFTANDELKIMKSQSISRIDICENKTDPSIVDLEFYSYKDPTVIFIFYANRDDVLGFNENELLVMWYTQCLSLIERTNITTAKRFLKNFDAKDYAIVYTIIADYKANVSKTDEEVAKDVAAKINLILKNTIEEKLCHLQNL